MKNNLSYYRHDVNSHNHWKFKTLRRKYKWCGEGKFWALNNMIGEAEGCRLDITDVDMKASIAADLDFDILEFDQFIEYLIKVCKLLIEEGGHLLTSMTQENLSEVNDKRERQRNWKKQKSTPENEKSTSTSQQSNIENQQSKVKESKVDEKKVEKSKEIQGAPAEPPPAKPEKIKSKRKEFAPPNQLEIQKFFIETIGQRWGESKARMVADACLDHYTANGWVQARGKPIVEWKAAARGWIRRDLNGDFSNSSSIPAQPGKQIPAPRPAISMPADKPPVPLQLTKEEADVRMKEFVNDLYGEFLAGTLRFEFLATNVYDYIKTAGMMKMAQSATDQIMVQAREKRMTELSASIAPAEVKLFSLYQTQPDAEEVKNDKGFLKMAKRLALIEFFSQYQARNDPFVFKLETNAHVDTETTAAVAERR